MNYERGIDSTKYATFKDTLSGDNTEIEMNKFKLLDNKLCGNYDSDFYTF